MGKLKTKQLHNLHFGPNIVSAIISNKDRLAEHAGRKKCMPIETFSAKRCECVDWVQVAHDKDHWWARKESKKTVRFHNGWGISCRTKQLSASDVV